MYSVVGCPECSALKIVENRPETTQCPRCGRQTKFKKLRTFYQSEEIDAAREIRARLFAEQSGHGEAYAEIDEFAELETDEAVVGTKEYLEQAGLDPESIADAGERLTTGTESSRSQKEVVLDALRELDHPTREEIVEYADSAGVSADYVEKSIDKLVRYGEVTTSGGRYRLL